MGLTSCRWITIAKTLARRRRVAQRHHAGCRVAVERAADRYTLICDGPGFRSANFSANVDIDSKAAGQTTILSNIGENPALPNNGSIRSWWATWPRWRSRPIV